MAGAWRCATAMAALAIAAGGCTSEVHRVPSVEARTASVASVSSAPAESGRPASLLELVGEWHPTTLLGRDVDSYRTIVGRRGLFAFHGRIPIAGGSDGCNVETYRFRFGPGDSIRFVLAGETTMRCHRPVLPFEDAMPRARHVRIVAGELRLTTAGGRVVATLTRATTQPHWVGVEAAFVRRHPG